jgi:hypothetical protein
MKNEFLHEHPDHNKLANEIISILRTEAPRIDKNHDILSIITFNLVRMSVCIPEEYEKNEIVEKFLDRVQELCNLYKGSITQPVVE